MSETIKFMKRTALEWRIAVLMFILFSINSLCSCIVAAMAGSVWSQLDNQAKFTVIVAIIGNWTGTILAFVSKQSQRIKQTGEVLPTTTENS